MLESVFDTRPVDIHVRPTLSHTVNQNAFKNHDDVQITARGSGGGSEKDDDDVKVVDKDAVEESVEKAKEDSSV
ncbi:hypothetical protein B9Z55_022959 [Caenorhabditis nigoni]|uniref:Uncharacterized protein n=1 Tax=Caenorhabditis nigoni TaxID=1611254 RepID=A0A2G5SML6_9PELO|nr:hypothetical protein B9Z55_022959 [Caenorhabditis nigoni]